jgi:hypothetical protein
MDQQASRSGFMMQTTDFETVNMSAHGFSAGAAKRTPATQLFLTFLLREGGCLP